MTLYILAFSQHLKFLHSFHHESLSGLTRERKENKKVISFLKTEKILIQPKFDLYKKF